MFISQQETIPQPLHHLFSTFHDLPVKRLDRYLAANRIHGSTNNGRRYDPLCRRPRTPAGKTLNDWLLI